MTSENSRVENQAASSYTNPMQNISGRMYDRITAILMGGREKGIRKASIELAAIKPGNHVLEIGCGTGTLTQLAKQRAGPEGKVFGIDPLPQMIERARQKALKAKMDITFDQGSMDALPFPDDSFDIVLASFMIFHTDPGIRQKGFDEIYRVLKEGGRFIVIDTEEPAKDAKLSLADKMSIRMAGYGMLDNLLVSLKPLLETSGFQSIDTGKMRYAIIGYMVATK